MVRWAMIPYSCLIDSLASVPDTLAGQARPAPHPLLTFLLTHYLQHQPFDEKTYLQTNPDVADALRAGTICSAKHHYVTQGYWEEREGAGPSFSEEWYLAQNPDVAAAVRRGDYPSGALHYQRYGRREGRCPNPELADLYATWRTVCGQPEAGAP